jgi:hypothetical protein
VSIVNFELWDLFLTSFFFFLPPHLGVKGVTYPALIRVGMMWGRGTGAFEKGMFGKDWGTHSAVQYERMYKSLRTKLKQPDFGPYDVLNLLIGEKNARVFSRRDRLNLATRPPTRSQ